MDSLDGETPNSSNKRHTNRQSNRSSTQQPHSTSRSVDAYIRYGQQGILSRTPPASNVASSRLSSSSRIRESSAVPIQNRSRSYERKSTTHNLRSTTMKWMKGSLIGKGSYGKVYIAFNATTGETMAVKQVEQPQTPSDHMKEPIKKMVQALKEENQTLKRLNHPNIVLYLGYEENPDTVNIFLEYVPGGTIHSCLEKHGIFHEEVTKSFATQVLDGLRYLHSKGIIHRDLKSENVLVEPHGVCKISDFGISKNILENERRRAFTLMKGTIYWMSPEVIEDSDRKGYTEKVDIWSLGCMMHEMWTASRPWANEVLAKVFEQLLDKRAPPLSNDIVLSPLARDFMNLCFQPDPNHRPGASILLAHPYLELSPQWSFPGMNHMGSRKQRDINANDQLRQKSSMSGSAVDPASEEHIQIISQTLKVGDLRISERTVTSAHPLPSNVTPEHQQPPPRGQSPPIVFIEPPPPRKRSISEDPMDDLLALNRISSLTPDYSSTQPTKPPRKLMIYNPDTNDTSSRGVDTKSASPFVYQPPPLPEKTPYSQHLAPASKASGFLNAAKTFYSGLSSSGGGPSSNHVPDTQEREKRPNLAKLRFAQPNPQSTVSPMQTSYSTDTGTASSTNSSMWKRPPVGLTKGKAPERVSTPGLPSNDREQRNSSGDHIAGMSDERPDVVEVYQHMGTLFPGHDLDKLVESPIDPQHGPNAESIVGRRYTMKSIRTIAHEQAERSRKGKSIRRSYYPQSPIWDAPLEEIK
ncbi:hypothetical protein CVT24_000543 [Panaeolus cyanescens]|uniref:Protein kinase domain-containing protein n=1 Tax=Panaeolus cyanescens TaxID=181874 RepID=A0A409VAJ7_9AGAR|nr:hypothetical protein CVT24_000543 [Panaeolus cyanescens]